MNTSLSLSLKERLGVKGVEIYERVNPAVTLRSETQQVVIRLCPQRQVLPTVGGDRSLLTADNGGKQEEEVVYGLSAILYRCIEPTHSLRALKSIFQHKRKHVPTDCQCFSIP
ncbi:unnamed protein product [Pleuronectes platessa]|uniref:Uncharacterized protein n=1 Tax=Pleuronectes platessa TaxID=8262 RepID=A0A9N7UWR2_PLEPL|nr:unnamed protein product [Pleuronectes platessa]